MLCLSYFSAFTDDEKEMDFEHESVPSNGRSRASFIANTERYSTDFTLSFIMTQCVLSFILIKCLYYSIHVYIIYSFLYGELMLQGECWSRVWVLC